VTEIDGVVRGLRADIQREILNHRGEGAGLVRSFSINCRRHGERVMGKLRDMRARSDASLHTAMIDAAETKVNVIVNDAIKAAETAGRVELAEVA
jgi:hypothetical protein